MNLQDNFNIERFNLGFIYHPYSEVKQELKGLIFKSLTEDWRETSFSLTDRNQLSPILNESDTNQVNVVLWQPEIVGFDLVVFLTNVSDGWYTLLNLYFKEYQRKMIRVVMTENNAPYPFYSFEYSEASSNRIIHSIKDSDKWVFFERGFVLPFECIDYYKKRKISHRMNDAIIEEYLLKNGLDISNDLFWKSKNDATLFSTKFNLIL